MLLTSTSMDTAQFTSGPAQLYKLVQLVLTELCMLTGLPTSITYTSVQYVIVSDVLKMTGTE